MTDADVAMGRVVAERYVVGRVLGSGTMGTVRAAFDLELDREVAIKFVTVETLARDEAIERFQREVEVVTRIRSEHVVRVLDVGAQSDGIPFMVMELLLGRGLDEERALRVVIPVGEAVSYLLPAIEVLAEAHASGVVHRDIKPANLFLEERPGAPRRVKVLDFGVSKSDFAPPDSFATEVGTVTGSPLYMAPEQLRSSESVDARADIWSLGAILFELVSGSTAHDGDSVADVCAALLRDPPRQITDFASELPPGFVQVVMRCLEPERERRYSNVAELGAALLPFAPGGAVHVERARQSLARRPLTAADPRDRVPASDAPVTVGIRESGVPGPALAAFSERPARDESEDVGRFRTFRMAIAFTFVGLGVGTAFLLEFPRDARRAPAVQPATATLGSPVSAPGVTHPLASAAPNGTASPAPPAPSVASVASVLTPETPPSAATTRSSFAPRAPARTWTPKSKIHVARPKDPASAGVSDFGGRR